MKNYLLFFKNLFYQFKSPGFYKQFIGKNKLFFDIGAHIGAKTKIFSSLGVKVVAVEPQSECVAKLKKKFISNQNIIIVKKGVTEEKGILKMNICSEATTISTLSDKWRRERFKNFKFDKYEFIKVVTLEDLIQEYGIPDFCKIDVEGYEFEVISGLKTKIPCLSFEFVSEFFDETKKCLGKLDFLGFKFFNYTDGENPRFGFKNYVPKDILITHLEKKLNEKNDFWGDIYAK